MSATLRQVQFGHQEMPPSDKRVFGVVAARTLKSYEQYVSATANTATNNYTITLPHPSECAGVYFTFDITIANSKTLTIADPSGGLSNIAVTATSVVVVSCDGLNFFSEKDPALVTLTDSTGDSATHDDTLAAITEAATITDSSGGTDPGDDTIAVITAAAAITDSSGGTDPGDDIIAAVTNVDTLTDSTGGAADDTVAAVAAPTDYAAATMTDPVTKAEGETFSTAMALLENEVTTAIGVANDNFKELTDQIITQGTANTAILAAIAQLAAKLNTTTTALTAVTAAVAQLAAKMNVTTTAVGVIKQNQSDVAQKVIELVANNNA